FCLFFFFFSSRRRHTRFSRDWSSDVCSSDLIERGDTGNSPSRSGKDGLFLLDSDGRELWKEDRRTSGWLTIIETLRYYDDSPLRSEERRVGNECKYPVTAER